MNPSSMKPSRIVFNYSSLHKPPVNQLIVKPIVKPIVFNTRPFNSLTPLERYRWRQREKERQEKEEQKKEEAERRRAEKARKDEETFQRNRESMANYKLPSVDVLFPCLLSKAANIPITALIHFCSCPATFKGRRSYLVERRRNYVRMSNLLKRPFFECEIQSLIQWFKLEKTYRLSFKKLLNRWLYNKYKDRKLNTEDPVTLQVPENPVYVFDINRRGMYIFEASCLKKRIETELMYSEWLFPKPKHPKNPLTNIEFTECQRIQILQNLREKGYGSWTFEAYRNLRWNLKQFQLQYQVPLKLAALHDLVKNPSSEDTIEYLQEFIEEHYDYHSLPQGTIRPSMTVLIWAVKHEYNTPYMKQWLRAFEEYNKLKITIGLDETTREDILAYNKLYRQTKALFSDEKQYTDIKNKYMEAHKHETPRLLVLPSVVERFAAVQEAHRQLLVQQRQLVQPQPHQQPPQQPQQQPQEQPQQQQPQQQQQDNQIPVIVRLASGDIRVIVPNRLFNLRNSRN